MTTFRQRTPQRNRNNRLRDLWQTYVASGDITALIISLVLLLMPALALDAADWPLQLSLTIPVMMISLFFGYFLSRSRYNELYALLVSGLYGLIAVILLAAFQNALNPVRGLQIVIIRSLEWVTDAFTGGINQDTLVFSMVVSVLFWFFGYNTAWHIFRLDRVWRVIIPPGLILLVNMVVYAGDSNLDIYLMVFALMSLLLIVRSNLDAREWDWYVNGVRVPQRLRRQFIGVGTAISLIALLIAWGIPSGNLQKRLDNFQQFLASDPVQQVAEFWNRLIEPIESEGPATADYYGGDNLSLGGAIQLGDQIIMLIDAPTDSQLYWRSRVFERYTNGDWGSSATRRIADLRAPIDIIVPPGSDLGRTTITQTITMSSPTRLIYAAPQPISVDIQGRIDLSRTNGNQEDPTSPMNVSVIRPERVIQRGQSYDVTSAISTASAFDLRAAGTSYPEWVSNPNASAVGISGRVAELARQIVSDANANNPYDQAKAIETFLRTNIDYNEQIPAPPPNVDPIEWFLFTQREGYCTYYATSMISMLRSLGVPARMAAGFSQGDYDATLGQYVVRERDAHTWVEVYFPGYGWVEFEPTSAQSPINRDGDNNPQESNPTEPTPQPTMTPTQAATATPQATATSEDTDAQALDSPPTATITPSPTPTATPVIVPTVAPPVAPPDPPNTSFLSFLLPAIGFAFLIFMAILIIVAIVLTLWWWWEWRGMRGLSPITRAYARLMRYLGLIGIYSRENETPEERRRRVVDKLPSAERPISAITRGYTVERYSKPREGTPEYIRQSQISDEAWTDARRSILVRWIRRFIPFLKD